MGQPVSPLYCNTYATDTRTSTYAARIRRGAVMTKNNILDPPGIETVRARKETGRMH